MFFFEELKELDESENTLFGVQTRCHINKHLPCLVLPSLTFEAIIRSLGGSFG